LPYSITTADLRQGMCRIRPRGEIEEFGVS
jgi:hypothetical protein